MTAPTSVDAPARPLGPPVDQLRWSARATTAYGFLVPLEAMRPADLPLTTIAAAAVVVTVLAETRGRIDRSTVTGLVLAFAAWVVATVLWTVDPERSTTRVFTFAQLMVLFLLVAGASFPPRVLVRVLVAYAAGATLAALSLVRNFVTMLAGFTVLDPRATAFGLNENDIALHFALAVPALLFTGATLPRRSLLRLLPAAAIPVHLLGIVLSGSRGALVAVAGGLLVWTLSSLWHRPAVALTVLAAAVLAVKQVVALLPVALVARFSTLSSQVSTGSFSNRGPIWGAAVELFWGRPLHGYGAGAFPTAITAELPTEAAPHSMVFGLLVEVGLIGTLLFAGIAAAAVAPALRQPASRLLVGSTTVTFLIGASLLNWDYRKGTWLLLSLAAAYAAGSTRRGRAPT